MSSRLNTVVVPTHTAALFERAVQLASEQLAAGEPVALPTETVYGLAANALDAAAVARVFQIKGRPAHNPIIVHVADLAMARHCTRHWPEVAGRLATAFWPGPLTLVLERAPVIPDLVTAGGPTVGIRWPSHPFIQAVIRRCGFPLAAPSANPSNAISPTNAGHVLQGLAGKIGLIVDGGQAQVGIESTVLDLTSRPAQLLRPGMIHRESLGAVLGPDGLRGGGEPPDSSGAAPRRSPGLLSRHYSPRARLLILGWRDGADLLSQIQALGLASATTHVIAHSQIPGAMAWGGVSVIPHDAEAYARAIYAELHRCDAGHAQAIIVETPPTGAAWQAVTDRLRRAAS